MRRYFEGEEQRKIEWQGEILSIQPRSTVWRYVLDNRTHKEIGCNLFLKGTADDEDKEFTVAISEKQYQKLRFSVGDLVKGTGWTKKYPELEYADYYRAGGFKILKRTEVLSQPSEGKKYDLSLSDNETVEMVGPPFIGELLSMDAYSWRGARMLSKSCWSGKCFRCIFATMSNVTIEYDFGVSQKYRFESFCYGPKSCPYYKKGAKRGVPYKGRGTDYDTGWLDDICTESRDEDD